MPNMSYCRFQNTLEDLKDCQNHMDDESLLPSEEKARDELVMVCSRIASDYDDNIPPLTDEFWANAKMGSPTKRKYVLDLEIIKRITDYLEGKTDLSQEEKDRFVRELTELKRG